LHKIENYGKRRPKNKTRKNLARFLRQNSPQKKENRQIGKNRKLIFGFSANLFYICNRNRVESLLKGD